MDDDRVMTWLKKKVKNVFIWLSTIWKNVDDRRKKRYNEIADIIGRWVFRWTNSRQTSSPYPPWLTLSHILNLCQQDAGKASFLFCNTLAQDLLLYNNLPPSDFFNKKLPDLFTLIGLLTIETITQSSLKLVCAYLSEDWATRLSATYSFPQLDALESRTQVSSVLDFGKRSGMDFDEDPKAKEVKVGRKKQETTIKKKKYLKKLTSFFSSFFSPETKNVRWSTQVGQG